MAVELKQEMSPSNKQVRLWPNGFGVSLLLDTKGDTDFYFYAISYGNTLIHDDSRPSKNIRSQTPLLFVEKVSYDLKRIVQPATPDEAMLLYHDIKRSFPHSKYTQNLKNMLEDGKIS